tara:strand:- start:345 stop:458 length:114 start_codon:yes stop_codon:yes gene_type:complete
MYLKLFLSPKNQTWHFDDKNILGSWRASKTDGAEGGT